MALRSLGAFALASACAVSAFQNTSPFFLFSNSDRFPPFDNASTQLVSANTLHTHLKQSLADCAPVETSESYIIVHQHGASTSDYQDDKSALHLSRMLDGYYSPLKKSIVVPEVVGQVHLETIQTTIQEKCGATLQWINNKDLSDYTDERPFAGPHSKGPRIITIVFPALPVQGAAEELADNDAFLADFLSNYMHGEQVTVIYMTTPRTVVEELATQAYEMDEPFPDSVNIELKRDVDSHADDKVLEGGLFEKYMFLSPGLFMGLTAAVPLFLILYVGITALTSLEVSYFAFSKEMGPGGQKK